MELSPEALQATAEDWRDRARALLVLVDRLADAPVDGFTAGVSPVAAGCRDTWGAGCADLADRAAGCAAALELALEAAVEADETVAAWWRRLAARIDDP